VSGPTSRLPVGLLDIFGISSGSYPRTLNDVISPVIEQLTLLASVNCIETINADLSGLVVGYNNGFVVPQGETWLVAGYTVSNSVTAIQQCEYQVTLNGLSSTGATFNPLIVFDRTGTAGVALRYSCAGSGGRPFFASSGQALGVFISTLTGNPSFNFRATILRCRR